MTIDPLTQAGSVICRLPGESKTWGLFTTPCEIINTTDPSKVISCMKRIEQLTASGFYAAGFVSYEAAPAFEPSCKVHQETGNTGFPLLWFGIYPEKPEIIDLERLTAQEKFLAPQFDLKISFDDYSRRLETLQSHIAAGDIYQANFTIRSTASAAGVAPAELFLNLCKNHPVPYAAFVNTGDIQLASISPELFLNRYGNQLTSSPMKGTVRREPLPDDDHMAADRLHNDEKNRAENLMITDMVRNDFGRVCMPGTIRVDPLFQVDTYRTVHQMISTVHGELAPDMKLTDIMKAAFPAASITGAPKIKAMELISAAETSPRKAYTGNIGSIFPNGDFCFNVAIRTMIFQAGTIELGIGGGIVTDSKTMSEWEEAILKSRFSSSQPEDFKILETMIYKPDTGIVLYDEHLQRARGSQLYFGRKWNEESIRQALSSITQKHSASTLRIRMTLDINGKPEISFAKLKSARWAQNPIKLKLSNVKTNSSDLMLYHKTTCRKLYDDAFLQAIDEGYDEVIFCNERGEVTEGAITNIFLRFGKQWITPPLSCGLLPGSMRALMIDKLNANEEIIYLEQLCTADELMVCNSVRGLANAELHISR